MNGKTHKIGGATAAMAVATVTRYGGITYNNYLTLGIFVGAAVVGALIPDIDHKNSTISHESKVLSAIVRIFCKHRGFTHSIPFLGLTVFLTALSSSIKFPYVSIAMGGLTVGIFSHMLLDFLNPKGIALFAPFSDKKYGIPLVTTGSVGEIIVRGILVIMLAYFSYVRFRFGTLRDFDFECLKWTLKTLALDCKILWLKICMKFNLNFLASLV